MSLHGFAKDLVFELISTTASEAGGVTVGLRLHWRDVPALPQAEAYPFSYRVEVHFTLYQGELSVRHSIENLATAATPAHLRDLPFAIGNHLSLRFPFGPDAEGWDDGRLVAATTEQLLLTPGSLLSGEAADRSLELGAGRAGMQLRAEGATDGVFGLPPSPALFRAAGSDGVADAARPCWMTLTQPGALSVRVSHELDKPSRRPIEEDPSSAARGLWDEGAWVAAQNRRLFVLWGVAPGAAGEAGASGAPGFLCVEPWVSGPDSLNTGDGLVVLGPSQRAEWTFRVQITDLRGPSSRA